MINFKKAKQNTEKMAIDRDILRYLIIDSKLVHTTALPDDDDVAQYIYVKPGMFEDVMDVSNIDTVVTIYAEHGIKLTKHKSHLMNKEVEVLFISASDIMKLNEAQRKFLCDTAPTISFGVQARTRVTQLINQIYQKNRMNSK